MDLTAFLTDHALPLTGFVFLPSAYLLFKGVLRRHQYDAVNAFLFSVLTYLAITAGNWYGGLWYAFVAGTLAWFYRRDRPRPARPDGSHEAL